LLSITDYTSIEASAILFTGIIISLRHLNS
jgi:hypothetical protein